MTKQDTLPPPDGVSELVKDIHNAIAELAGISRYPDLTEAIDRLAALAAQAPQPTNIEHLTAEAAECAASDDDCAYALLAILQRMGPGASVADVLGVLEAHVAQAPQPLDSIEQYRLQMAGISTAAIGYWKEGDPIYPDYDTVALRDVAKLYAKYDELYKQQAPHQAQGVSDDSVQVDRRDLFDAVRAAFVAGGTTDDSDTAKLWGDATDYANRNPVVQSMLASPQAAPAPQALTDADKLDAEPLAPIQLDAAAKKLAELFDYPWEHMPAKGRQTMRSNVIAVLQAINAARATSAGGEG